MAGTATNTGLGPWLESERKAAKHLILQYPRASWSKDPAIIKQADAIEIQFGQGANAGVGKTLDDNKINSKLRQRLNLKPGQDAVIHNQMTEANSPGELGNLINYLRELSGGVPIGVKIGAGNNLEQDLDIAVNAGADFVSLDGAEAGTHNSLPILEDDFGVPTVIALCRAVRFWESNKLKGKVSLLVGGGLSSPGDCLKMLGLGADAVYLGTTIVFATTHNQLLKVVPFEPPTAIAWEDGKYKDKFNVKEGAKSLAHFLHATVYEMEEAVKALGKTSVSQVSRADMFALNREVAEITGLELCYRPAK
jgi:glutamate synthase domain-containing protein 2